MARIDELRLMTKVARMYYQERLRQTEVMKRLNVSQSTVSRLLKRAEHEGIVRITIAAPSGIHTDLEQSLETKFGLTEAIVVDSSGDEDLIVRDLGAAAAFYLETTLQPTDTVGISSWSAALLSMVHHMHPTQRAIGAGVVQILGGVGNPGAEAHATQLTQRLANLISGKATLLPAPGVVGSAEARAVLMKDPFVRQAMELFNKVTLALVGVGAIEPSRLLASSGNVFSPGELRRLSQAGAVGDICLRFFDKRGCPVASPLNERVIGMNLDALRKAKRVVAVAGGRRKLAAIRAALLGKLVNVLITDRQTATSLLEEGTGDINQPKDRKIRTAANKSWKGIKAAGILALLLYVSSCVPWTTRPINQKSSDASDQAEQFDDSRVIPAIRASAVDLDTVLKTFAENPEAAERKYGHREEEGPFNFAVKDSGRVLAIHTKSRIGTVDITTSRRGVADASLLIGPVIPGTALRDSVGLIHFDQFKNQIEYAEAANSLNRNIENKVLDPVRGRLKPGQTVDFVGVFSVPPFSNTSSAQGGGCPLCAIQKASFKPQIVPVELRIKDRS